MVIRGVHNPTLPKLYVMLHHRGDVRAHKAAIDPFFQKKYSRIINKSTTIFHRL